MLEATFWEVVARLGWGKSYDHEAMKRTLIETLPHLETVEKQRSSALVGRKLGRLVVTAEREEDGPRMSFAGHYHRLHAALAERLDPIPTGLADDGFDDFCAHIVGLGREEYMATMANPRGCIYRARSGDFVESFAYVIPDEIDYKRARDQKSEADEAAGAATTTLAREEEEEEDERSRNIAVRFDSVKRPGDPPFFLARDVADADGLARLTSTHADLWTGGSSTDLASVAEAVLRRASRGYRVTVVSAEEAIEALEEDP